MTMETHVKKSFSISPMSPKLLRGWPWTSQMARNKQAFPSRPSVLSMSSAVPYNSALSPPWKAFFGASWASRLCILRLMNDAMKSAITMPASRPFIPRSKTGGRAPYGFSLSVNPSLSKSTENSSIKLNRNNSINIGNVSSLKKDARQLRNFILPGDHWPSFLRKIRKN